MTGGPDLSVLLDDRGAARAAVHPWLRDRHVDVVWVVTEAIDAPGPDEAHGVVPVVALSPLDVVALQAEPAAPGVEVALVVFASVDLLARAMAFGFTTERIAVPHYAPDDDAPRTAWSTDIAFTDDEAAAVQAWLDGGCEVVAQRLPRVTPRPLSAPGD